MTSYNNSLFLQKKTSRRARQDESPYQKVKSIAVVGSYPPRKCGIATFTYDFCNSLEKTSKNLFLTDIIAVNDSLEKYSYSSKVKYEITSDSLDSYIQAAEYINRNRYYAVILQHEFGLFGGSYGEYILNFTMNLQTPLYIVLHSVLKFPGSKQHQIIHKLDSNSSRLIVMNPIGCEILKQIYCVNPDNISMIHHGVPDIPRGNIQASKECNGFTGKKILMSYGLIGPGKGYEYVIDALPAIAENHPDVLYIIAGSLHPHIYNNDNDIYLNHLKEKIYQNDVAKHVLMCNQYMSNEELYSLLNSADVFVAPYLCQEQITSGTLACAMACGKAIVATPTWYAQEVLAENRGVIVPFRDSHKLAQQISILLHDPIKQQFISRNAYKYSRYMLWENVTRQYMDILNIKHSIKHKPKIFHEKASLINTADKRLPPINLSHLLTLTDGTGIMQHSKYSVPYKQSGYCVDDAARALITINNYYQLFNDKSVLEYIRCYFNFLKSAFNRDNECFRNVLNTREEWDGEKGSQDAQGRAIWALSSLIESAPDKALLCQAMELFHRSIHSVNNFNYPRPIAFSILGMYKYLKICPEDKKVLSLFTEKTYELFDLYKYHQSSSWRWFEDKLSYDNAKLCHALLMGANYTKRSDILAEAISSLKWLIHIQTNPEGYLSVIGNKKWMVHNMHRSNFDQQPLEAMALVHCCADCFRLTGDSSWREKAYWCFEWFLGKNHIGLPMFDKETGGGYDGFNASERNENQGAEATISWLFSWLEIFDIFKGE